MFTRGFSIRTKNKEVTGVRTENIPNVKILMNIYRLRGSFEDFPPDLGAKSLIQNHHEEISSTSALSGSFIDIEVTDKHEYNSNSKLAKDEGRSTFESCITGCTPRFGECLNLLLYISDLAPAP